MEVFLTVKGNLWEETNKKPYNEKRGGRFGVRGYIKSKKVTYVNDCEVLHASALFIGEKLSEKGWYLGF